MPVPSISHTARPGLECFTTRPIPMDTPQPRCRQLARFVLQNSFTFGTLWKAILLV